MKTKNCRRCKLDISVDNFRSHPSSRDKLQPYCNSCVREYYRPRAKKYYIQKYEYYQDYWKKRIKVSRKRSNSPEAKKIKYLKEKMSRISLGMSSPDISEYTGISNDALKHIIRFIRPDGYVLDTIDDVPLKYRFHWTNIIAKPKKLLNKD